MVENARRNATNAVASKISRPPSPTSRNRAISGSVAALGLRPTWRLAQEHPRLGHGVILCYRALISAGEGQSDVVAGSRLADAPALSRSSGGSAGRGGRPPFVRSPIAGRVVRRALRARAAQEF